jgi:hypothetical protein
MNAAAPQQLYPRRVHFHAQPALAGARLRLVFPLRFNPADMLPFLFPFFMVFLQPLPRQYGGFRMGEGSLRLTRDCGKSR